MSSFRKPILVLMGLALLVSAGTVFGQGSALYSNNATQLQTRNIPAGTVVDPGSQLLYIMDTGVNLRAAVGANVSQYTSPLSVVNQGPRDTAGNFIAPNPFGVGGPRSIYNADGTVNPDLFNRNFLTITNTHPTQAVTVHFRYFNDECVDVLDFLVLLTCNDTLIFDPFCFNIPGTSFNTQNRIFGPAVGLFRPIRAADFASGRFLIFATAAGTSYEPANTGVHNDNAELRFPFEFRNFVSPSNHCDNLVGTNPTSGNPNGTNAFFGLASGLVANNLHVFNSSAVSFNYLIGNWTTAVPFNQVFQAYGINAWTRPAVDLTNEFSPTIVTPPTPAPGEADSNRQQSDGDGPPLLAANDWRILTGTELVRAANGSSVVQDNQLFLRNDVHGGDSARIDNINFLVDSIPDPDSHYGALGTTSLYGANPSLQTFNFLSVVDDYNGSRHANDTPVGGFIDRSYNLNGARTVYVLQIYDNRENLFDVEEDTPINISPPPFEAPTAILKITVDCLRVWITDIVSDATSVDDLSIADLGGIAEGLVAHLTQTVNPKVDASQGWIRFVRDNTVHGTWVLSNLNQARGVGRNDQNYASFVTIANQVIRFSGFGASWWLSSAASDPLVSDTGDPQCDGACPNGAGRR